MIVTSRKILRRNSSKITGKKLTCSTLIFTTLRPWVDASVVIARLLEPALLSESSLRIKTSRSSLKLTRHTPMESNRTLRKTSALILARSLTTITWRTSWQEESPPRLSKKSSAKLRSKGITEIREWSSARVLLFRECPKGSESRRKRYLQQTWWIDRRTTRISRLRDPKRERPRLCRPFSLEVWTWRGLTTILATLVDTPLWVSMTLEPWTIFISSEWMPLTRGLKRTEAPSSHTFLCSSAMRKRLSWSS